MSKQPGDSVTPYPLGASSAHTEVTLHPKDTPINPAVFATHDPPEVCPPSRR